MTNISLDASTLNFCTDGVNGQSIFPESKWKFDILRQAVAADMIAGNTTNWALFQQAVARLGPDTVWRLWGIVENDLSRWKSVLQFLISIMPARG